MKGIFVEPKDLMIIHDISHRWAWEKLKIIKTVLGKNNITVNEFCHHEQINKTEFIEAISKYQK